MHSMGLKPWEDDDVNEGKAILESFARSNEDDGAANDANKTSGGGSSGAKGGHNGQNSKK